MTKIVYNNCFGGFTISREGVLLGRKLSGDPNWGGPCIIGDFFNKNTPVSHDFGSRWDDGDRHDPILVEVVETLGEKAGGDCSNLCIEEIPSGSVYWIDEYDGRESVRIKEDYPWPVA